MASSSAVSVFRSFQTGFQLIAALHLTSFLCPPQAQVEDGASFDFIVVGGGTAGNVMANRLTENPTVSVLLIEAGGDPPLEATLPATLLFTKQTKHDWNYTSEQDKYVEKCHKSPFADVTQGKMLGGTSSLNYFLYGRGNAGDYDSWAADVGDELWKWNNVLPYFIKSETMTDASILNSPAKVYHGTKGNIGVSLDSREEDVVDYLNTMKEVGGKIVPDVTEDNPLGYLKLMFTIAKGTRQGSAYCYLFPAKDRPNLRVLKNTIVTKVIIDENKHAVGVEAITDDGNKITMKAKKEVIVSAGAINSPKLLMLSGIGPKKHLEENKISVVVDLPVGQNLQDHVGVNIIHHFKSDHITEFSDPRMNPAPAVMGYSALNESQKYPDYQTMTFFVNAGDHLATLFCSVALGFKDEICGNVHQESSVGKRAVFIQVVNLKPKSKGEVRLRSPDPMDPPMIHTNYFSDESDLDNLVSYVEHFSQSFKTSFFTKRNIKVAESEITLCSEFEGGSKDYWKCYVSCMMSGMNYWAGTAAMGPVLDSRLRVRGVTGLRVVDASVMPRLPSGNIYAPVVMIAEKAADFIKQDNKL